MVTFNEAMDEYRSQLKRGYLQVAYQGLMAYYRDLRAHFANAFPHDGVSGGIQYGYMDLTYFTLAPGSLKARKLKLAIVFAHDTFRFEIWLSGANREVQAKYWKRIRAGSWHKYQLASNPRTDFYLLSHILVEAPDFADLYALTKQIERGTLEFARDMEEMLPAHEG